MLRRSEFEFCSSHKSEARDKLCFTKWPRKYKNYFILGQVWIVRDDRGFLCLGQAGSIMTLRPERVHSISRGEIIQYIGFKSRVNLRRHFSLDVDIVFLSLNFSKLDKASLCFKEYLV